MEDNGYEFLTLPTAHPVTDAEPNDTPSQNTPSTPTPFTLLPSPDAIWSNLTLAVCHEILHFQPGHLNNVSTTDTGSNLITTQPLEPLFNDPITDLVAVMPMPPAATEMTPQGTEPNAMGHYPHGSLHGSIPAPYPGNKNEDPASLPVGPPQGSTTQQPASLHTFTEEQNESSLVDNNDKDTIQWGAYQPTLIPVGWLLGQPQISTSLLSPIL